MSICGKCIHYEICDEYVSPCETFPEIENGCPCYKSKDDFSEVKHGEWIVHPHCYECSICEFEYELDVSAFEYIPTTDCCLYFCPCCGAKMDGERKEQ